MKEHERQESAAARFVAADARDKRRAELLANRRYPVDDQDLMEENALRAEVAGGFLCLLGMQMIKYHQVVGHL